jgi:excisionase family DNA binding protein
VLKVNELAERLRVSSSTIYNLVEEGRIACYRIGKGRGSIRFSEEQVEAFLQSSRVEPGTLKSGFRFTHSRTSAGPSSAPPLSRHP